MMHMYVGSGNYNKLASSSLGILAKNYIDNILPLKKFKAELLNSLANISEGLG